MEIRFHPSAISDARKIYQYYSDISHELGDAFWHELEQFIEKARLHPTKNHFDLLGNDLRRSNLKKFPINFLYRILEGQIRITTVRHDKSKPSYGLRRK